MVANATAHFIRLVVSFVTEQRNIQNTVFREESFGKNLALYVYLTYKDDPQRCLSFSKRFGPRIMLLESLPKKQSPYSFLRLNKWEIYQLKLWKRWQKAMITDVKKKTNYDPETNTSDIGKLTERRKQPELRRWGKNMQLYKKDTQLK